MDTLKKQLPLLLTIVAGIVIAGQMNELIAKAKVKAMSA